MTAAWKLTRGAMVGTSGTRFSVWAPKASHVSVVIDGGDAHELAPLAGGEFAGEIRDVRAGADYRYRLDGNAAYPDPVSRHQLDGVYGPSRVVDPAAFRWTDQR